MPKPILEESDNWDELSLQQLLAQSTPIDAELIDRRKPKKAISMRVDPDLITATKKIAAEWGIGYQTLFRTWLNIGFQRYCKKHMERMEREEAERELANSESSR